MKLRLIFSLVAPAVLCSQSLSRGERDYAMSQLHATRKMLLDAVQDVSPAQWKFKPAPDRRSIAECVEHIVLAEDFITEKVRQLLQDPAQTDRKPVPEDDAVYRQAADPARAPALGGAALSPRGRFALPEDAAQAFRQRRDRTIAYIATTEDPLRARFDGAGEDALDAYQLFLRLAGHTERMVEEINRIKTDPKFPRSPGGSRRD
ncbi:MAG: DinB family protein [Bryobacterales bacterium]|nr:DinB family protein [Bryobacteraceae bacterium]MDW8131295.1 DinB family protein [Bryobacterales bacterium]